MPEGFFGKRLTDKFRLLDDARSVVSRSLRNAEIGVTEIRSGVTTPYLTRPAPPQEGYNIGLQFRDFSSRSYTEKGFEGTCEFRAGGTHIYDYKRTPVTLIEQPFHSLQFYISRAAFDAIAEDSRAAVVGELRRTPGRTVADPVIKGIGDAMVAALDHREQANRIFLEHVMLALITHVATSYGGMRADSLAVRGGLAAWQQKRTLEIIDANLDGDISPAALAGECGLSPSHFARAFRKSTGVAPHQWLLQRRVEKARQMMRQSDAALTEIALACGFADQSHFTRVFSKVTGVSPGVWRRQATANTSA